MNEELLVSENVEQQTEVVEEQVEQVADESSKVYTEEDIRKLREEYDRKLDKKISRNNAKVRKEYERKYGRLEEVLRAGTGVESVEDMTTQFTDFYTKKGIDIPKTPQYTQRDIEILASAEADEIIRMGFEDVVEEVDRLAELGANGMDEKEKVIFRKLAEYRQNNERANALSKLGVKKDVYESADFKDFAKQFNANTPIENIYNLYQKTQPKQEFKTMGSMKSNTVKDSGVKEFYTVEEARRFTKKDYDNNPELYRAVQNSMLKWK